MNKKAVVIFSGGLDSTVCLAWAQKKFGGASAIAAISFDYKQRHINELTAAKKICERWGIQHKIIALPFLHELTDNALTRSGIDPSGHTKEGAVNAFVTGRNGFFLHMAALYAHSLSAHHLVTGVNEIDSPDFPDCRPAYIEATEKYLKCDFGEPLKIETPLIQFQKEMIWELGHQLGIIDLLLHDTVTCYNGVAGAGCGTCPSCDLRQKGLALFLQKYPQYHSQS